MKNFAAVLLLICGSSNAAVWVPLVDTDNIKVWVESGSLAQSGKYKKAWFKQWHLADQPGDSSTNFKPYRWTKQLTYFSCSERTSGTIQMIYYAGDTVAGDYVGANSIRAAQASFDEIAPDTIGEVMINYACKPNPQAK